MRGRSTTSVSGLAESGAHDPAAVAIHGMPAIPGLMCLQLHLSPPQSPPPRPGPTRPQPSRDPFPFCPRPRRARATPRHATAIYPPPRELALINHLRVREVETPTRLGINPRSSFGRSTAARRLINPARHVRGGANRPRRRWPIAYV